MKVKTITSAKARESFSELLNETGFGGHRIVVTRKGKAVAAIVPLEDLDIIQQFEDQKDSAQALHILSDPGSEYISWNQAKKELKKKK